MIVGAERAISLAKLQSALPCVSALDWARLGQRAAGEDQSSPPVQSMHDQVLVLLGQSGLDGAEVERDFRRLLPLKTKAEYEPDEIAESVATKAVERGIRCAQIAFRVVASMN